MSIILNQSPNSYYNKIQDFDDDFYRGFHLVVCGLDSIVARRWINGMLLSLLCYEDGMLDQVDSCELLLRVIFVLFLFSFCYLLQKYFDILSRVCIT